MNLNQTRPWRICFGAFLLLTVLPALAFAQDTPGANMFAIHIPPETQAVGVFQEGRSLREEYDYLSMILFSEGEFLIPADTGQYPLGLIKRFEFGPERKLAKALTQGRVDAVAETIGDRESVRFTFQQDFDADGTKISILIDYWQTDIIDGQLDPAVLVFDEAYLSQRLYMIGKIQIGVRVIFLKFASLGYESLPLYLINLELEDNQFIQLYQRWQPPMAGSGPANLVYSAYDVEEQRGVQSDYWKLVYAAEHHNWDQKYWVFFDEPAGEARGLAVITEDFPSAAEVYIFDRDFVPLRSIKVRSMSMELFTGIFPPAVKVESWRLY